MTERKDACDKSAVMKLDVKRRGQYVMKREQRGMFKISSRTKITPKDDLIGTIEESISVTHGSNHLISQTPPGIGPVLHHTLFPPLTMVNSVCVGSPGVKGQQRALMALS